MDLYVYDSCDGPTCRHAMVRLEQQSYLLVQVDNHEGSVGAALLFVRSHTRRGDGVRVYLRTRRSLGAADALVRGLEAHGRRCDVGECGNALLRDMLRLSRGPTTPWRNTGLSRRSIAEGVTLVEGAAGGVRKAQAVCIVTGSRKYMHNLCRALNMGSSPLRDVVVVGPSKGASPTMCELVKAATDHVYPHMTVTLCEASHDAYYTENDHHASKLERVAAGLGIKLTRFPDWFDTLLMHGGLGRHLVEIVGCVRSRRGWLHMDVRPRSLPLAVLSLQRLLFLEFHANN